MDPIDQEAADYFTGLPGRLRAQRLAKRLGSRTDEQTCADCKAGSCATHMKPEDADLFAEEGTDDAGAPPTQE